MSGIVYFSATAKNLKTADMDAIMYYFRFYTLFDSRKKRNLYFIDAFVADCDKSEPTLIPIGDGFGFVRFIKDIL